jgi:hypothetical protein
MITSLDNKKYESYESKKNEKNSGEESLTEKLSRLAREGKLKGANVEGNDNRYDEEYIKKSQAIAEARRKVEEEARDDVNIVGSNMTSEGKNELDSKTQEILNNLSLDDQIKFENNKLKNLYQEVITGINFKDDNNKNAKNIRFAESNIEIDESETLKAMLKDMFVKANREGSSSWLGLIPKDTMINNLYKLVELELKDKELGEDKDSKYVLKMIEYLETKAEDLIKKLNDKSVQVGSEAYKIFNQIIKGDIEKIREYQQKASKLRKI